MSLRYIVRAAVLAASLTAAALPLLSSAPDADAATTNLVKNPGCESSTAGWMAFQGTLTRDTSAHHSGVASCRVTYTVGGYATLDDAPATVVNPPRQAQYNATAWVRSSTAVGKPIRLILRQTGGSAAMESVASGSVALSTAWQRLSVSARVNAGGRTALEAYVSMQDAVTGNSFQVDDVTLIGGLTADILNSETYYAPLFSASSVWNSPISAGATTDPHSAAMIANLGTSVAQHFIAVNLDNSAMPLFYADASTPRVHVGDNSGWWGGMTAPMPPTARPDPGVDHHLTVWDVPNNLLYDFWDMRKNSSGAWSAGYGITFDSRGLGYQTGIWQTAAREYGGSIMAGVIRYNELRSGAIRHALSIAYPYPRTDRYARGMGPSGVLAIASRLGGELDPVRMTVANIPEGARLRLKANVDLNARCGADTSCKIIGQTLKTYGAYMTDNAAVTVFYAEDLVGRSVSWDGLLTGHTLKGFQATDFEVLAMPALTPRP